MAEEPKLLDHKYKLVYFDARGLAEPIRWILAYKGITFEDHRIHHDDWKVHVKGYSWGKLPILFENELELTQSCSIARYLARRYKLDGNTEYEAHLCDQYVDHIFDFLNGFAPWYAIKNKAERMEARKGILVDIVPDFLNQFERVNKLRPGPYLLGDQVAYADFYLASFLDVLEADEFLGPKLLADYPELTQQKKDVMAIPQIKKIIETNPSATACCTQCQKYVLADKDK